VPDARSHDPPTSIVVLFLNAGQGQQGCVAGIISVAGVKRSVCFNGEVELVPVWIFLQCLAGLIEWRRPAIGPDATGSPV
jgi:hypothetical protein